MGEVAAQSVDSVMGIPYRLRGNLEKKICPGRTAIPPGHRNKVRYTNAKLKSYTRRITA